MDTPQHRDRRDQVALVTGGAQGIGAGVARRLAEQGALVVIADVQARAAEALARSLGGHGVACDVRDLAQCQRAVGVALERFGRLDIVHLNAGVASGGGVTDGFSVEGFRRALAVNVEGVVYGLVAAVPALRAGGGDVVVTASLAGLVGTPFDPVYAMTKHALVGLVRSVGTTLAAEGIRVNAICPGFVRTAMVSGMEEEIDATFGVPLLEVDAVADAVMTILDTGVGGECWFLQPGRPVEPFRFRHVPGPGAPPDRQRPGGPA